MKFYRQGEETLHIQFAPIIDDSIHHRVMALYHFFRGKSGITFVTPAYQSLSIGFDSTKYSFTNLKEECASFNFTSFPNESRRKLTLPICYDEKFALDRKHVEKQLNRSFAEIVDLHKTIVYRVFMLGFLPGFPYLGRLPDDLITNRKASPRRNVPARSVGIAGAQTGVYPSESPGGWNIIGRTPVSMLTMDEASPCFFTPGDEVTIEEISIEEYNDLADKRKENG